MTIYEGDTEVMEGCKTHFSMLAKPGENLASDSWYSYCVEKDYSIIADICASMDNNLPQVTLKHMIIAVQSLNNNKSPDLYGISAEHIRYSGAISLKILTRIVNFLIFSRKLPPFLK